MDWPSFDSSYPQSTSLSLLLKPYDEVLEFPVNA